MAMKKEGAPTQKNVHISPKHKVEKPDTKKYILFDPMYKKSKWTELICKEWSPFGEECC